MAPTADTNNMEHEILTKDDYIKILQEKFGTKDIEFKDALLEPLSDNIEGFMGDHYTLKLNYKKENIEGTVNLFVKTKPTKTDLQKEMAEQFNPYDKEIFIYNHLFKEFEKNGFCTHFAPKSYYCKDRETIVMDNMRTMDYSLSGRWNFYDGAHCKTALKSLAQYHANCIAYEENKSKSMGKTYRVIDEGEELFKEIFFIKGDTDSMGAKFIIYTKESFIKVSKIMPESEEWKRSFEKRLNDFDWTDIFWRPLPYRTTCTHGDLWSNNMLFKYVDGVAKHCCLLDFQLLRHHHTAYDACLLIHSNTRRGFKQQHKSNLLKYYYDSFEEALKENGYEANAILPYAHFLGAVRALEPVAVLQGVATMTFTLLPEKVTSDAVNSGGDHLENMMFQDRPRIVLEAAQTNEEFKQVMMDHIYDLNEVI